MSHQLFLLKNEIVSYTPKRGNKTNAASSHKYYIQPIDIQLNIAKNSLY